MSMPTVRSESRSVATLPSSSGSCSCPPWPCDRLRALHADRERVHLHLHAIRAAALDVGAVDLRILVLIFDLVAALVDVLIDALVVEVLRQLPLVAAPADREIARRVAAGVEVLVPPAS